MPYKEKVKQMQKRFEKYCDKLKKGKARRPKDLPEDVIISTDTFKMCFADLPEDNPFYTCRRQMPINWFISEDGIVLTFKNGATIPSVLKDNSNTEERRTDNERQHKINTATLHSFQRVTCKDRDGNIKYKEDGITPEKKEKPKTLMNYALVAIIYASEGRTIALLDDKLKENIKKYGLEAFGKPNKGYTKKKTEEAEEAEEEKTTSLIYNGKEVISSDDMLVVHHVEEGYIIHPDLLEIMPNWLHKEMDIITASTPDKESRDKMLRKCNRAMDFLMRIYPNGYITLDNANEILNNGKSKKYINHSAINKKREDGERHTDNRYYKIVPIKTNARDTTIEIVKQIQLQEDTERILRSLDKGIDTQKEIPFDVIGEDKELHRFYIVYKSGDKNVFKRFIKRLKYDLKYRKKVYENILMTYKEHNSHIVKHIKNTDCCFFTYTNAEDTEVKNND